MTNIQPDREYDNLPQVLDFVISQKFKNINTIMPGIVHEYDSSKRRASIIPGLRVQLTEPNDDGKMFLDRNPISNVPVIFPSGGGYSITFNLIKGDAVLLVCAQRGINNFKNNLKLSDPDMHGGFAIKDAIAIAGFSNEGGVGDGLLLRGDGGAISINNDGIALEANNITISTRESATEYTFTNTAISDTTITNGGSLDFTFTYDGEIDVPPYATWDVENITDITSASNSAASSIVNGASEVTVTLTSTSTSDVTVEENAQIKTRVGGKYRFQNGYFSAV